MDLTAEECETLNAYGPYGFWRGRGVLVTHEESLTGRAEFIASTVRRALTDAFSADQMKEMRLVDIGCYDGWLLEQLADLPFKQFVGIEPRQRNIAKGEIVRRILRLPTKGEYRLGTLESITDERFDVVLCTGLLHHVESIGDTIRKLRAVCGKFLFMESQCLSPHHERTAESEIEPKDVIYFGKEERTVGLVGYKYESGFYDGSAVSTSIVSIPTPSAVCMFLEQAGFSQIEILKQGAPWSGGPVKREAKALYLSARVSETPPEMRRSAAALYEEGLAGTRLDAELLASLHRRYCLGASGEPNSALERYIIGYLSGAGEEHVQAWQAIASLASDKFEREIIKNFRYAPKDKITLELAKVRLCEREYQQAFELCKTITTGLNADWRSCYRGFKLMSVCAEQLGHPSLATHYAALAEVACPLAPAGAADECRVPKVVLNMP